LSEIEVCRHGDIPLREKEPIPDKRISKKELKIICKKEAQDYKADLATHSDLLSKIILWDEV